MASSHQRAIQGLLVVFLALLLASIAISNPTLDVVVEVGFGFAALYFGYATYTNESYPDGPAKTVTAAAFALAGLGQFFTLLTGRTAVDLATTAVFVVAFIGYVVLNRR